MGYGRLGSAGVVCVIALVISTGEVRGDSGARIEHACAKSQVFLRSKQNKDGSWQSSGRSPAFQTAYVLYTLIATGAPPRDRAVAAGLRWFEERPWTCGPGWPASVGAAALLVQCLCATDPEGHRERIRELCDHLVRAQRPEGCWTGTLAAGSARDPYDVWTTCRRPTWRAARALAEASATARYHVPPEVWATLLDYCRRTRARSGAWGPSPTSDAGYAVRCTAMGMGTSVLCGEDREAIRGSGKLLRKWWLGPWRRQDKLWPAGESVAFAMSAGLVSSDDVFAAGARRILEGRASDGGWGTPVGKQDRLVPTCEALLYLARAPRFVEGSAARSRRVVITPRTRFHAPTTVESLEAAFGAYLELAPIRQRTAMYRFGPVGPAVLGFLVAKLRDGDERKRACAFQLLGVLTAEPLEFDAGAEASVREEQVRVLEAKAAGEWQAATWDGRGRRFHVPR